MADTSQGTSLNDVAKSCGVGVETVREILNEVPGKNHAKELQDQVFQTARKMGYDFRKLKIGKRMDLRGRVYEEVMKAVLEHPDWGRDEIVRFLEQGLGLVKRVQRKSFPEEFSD